MLKGLLLKLDAIYLDPGLVSKQNCDRCGDCCVDNVFSTFIEGFNVHSYLREYFGEEKTHTWMVRPPRIGFSSMSGKKTLVEKCNSLYEKECLVYPARPFECRRYVKKGKICGYIDDYRVHDSRDIVIPGIRNLNNNNSIPNEFKGRIGYLRDLLNDIENYVE